MLKEREREVQQYAGKRLVAWDPTYRHNPAGFDFRLLWVKNFS